MKTEANADPKLAQTESITLSARDFARFIEAIQNPAEPTPTLRVAVEEYKRLRAQEPQGNW